MEQLTKTIFLIGFMGVGKTTISQIMGNLSNAKVMDTDEWIVQKKKMSIPEIFEKYGEQYFRDLETLCLKKIAEDKPCIVSCGGGIILREENRKIMHRTGSTVWLDASAQTIYDRVKNGKNRPLLNNHMNISDIEEMMEKRKSQYEAAMDYHFYTDEFSKEEVAKEVLQKVLQQDT